MSLQGDYFHNVHQYIYHMLMDEDDQDVPMFHESAIQETEKSFYEILDQEVPSNGCPQNDNIGTSHDQCINSNCTVALEDVVGSNQIQNPNEPQTSLSKSYHQNNSVPPSSLSSDSSSNNVNPLVKILMGDDQEVPMFQESAIQATEKSLYKVLDQNSSHDDDDIDNHHNQCPNSTTVALEIVDNSNQMHNPGELQSSLTKSYQLNDFVPPSSPSSSNNVNPFVESVNYFFNGSKGKKHYFEESTDTNDCLHETQSNKQLARYSEETTELSDMLDKVSLCPDCNTTWQIEESVLQVSRGRKPQDKRRQVVDLKRLLNQCASSVSNGDYLAAKQTLCTIREQSSPQGDGTQRLAHYMAAAIEARINGNGTTLYADFVMMGISFADTLNAYQSYFTAVPFQRMSNIFANKAIYKQTMGATKLHIIDFGISYGFQWPCIIQAFSSRPGGSPYLRITGIDFPEPGFLPLKRVAKTGSCLSDYCKRFNIPFEYNCIAKKWDSIRLEDLKIEEGERLVVNCLYRLRQVPDETVLESGPRDVVLKLIKRINPELLVLGVLHGNHSSAFFNVRFREALAHFSNLSDMFEATLAHEDKSRLVLEQAMLAKDAVNVIACEGTTRIERPEKYNRWTSRIMKAGFMQTPLPKEILAEVKGKVRLQYNKKFLVREDNKWMLQGWNGRVLYALSLWNSVQE